MFPKVIRLNLPDLLQEIISEPDSLDREWSVLSSLVLHPVFIYFVPERLSSPGGSDENSLFDVAVVHSINCFENQD